MLDLLLLLFLVVCAIAAVSLKDLLSVTIILGAYSLIMAVVWTRLNAVDVAFTEASVGAGMTTLLAIAALTRTKRMEEGGTMGKKASAARRAFIFAAVILTAVMLIYGTMDMPDFEDPLAPMQTHVAPRYIAKSYEEAGVPNFVTAVLANYRGYDTLGETTVIFTSGISVILLLRRRKK